MSATKGTTERFLKNVRKTGSCWIWTGAAFKGKYGAFWYERRTIGAHRASWLILRGEIPAGVFVCHRCDIPLCVNPDHLFLATPKENTLDMVTKGRGRWVSGESHYMSKLTDAQIIEMAALRGAETQAAVARKFGISRALVSMLWAGHGRGRIIKPLEQTNTAGS